MSIKLEKIDINLEKNKIGVNMNVNGQQVRHTLVDQEAMIDSIFRAAKEDYEAILKKNLNTLLGIPDQKEEKKKDAKSA